MAELLVRVIDKKWERQSWLRTGESLRWRYHTKAGDVIAVVPNGHSWGRKEVSAPYWRIFCLPEYPLERFAEMFTGENHWSEKVQTRLKFFDLSGPWARGLIMSGQVITMTGADAKRFLNLKRTREQAVPIMVA